MDMLRRGLGLIFSRRDFGLLMGAQFAAQAGDGIVQTALAKLIVFGGQRGFDVEGARTPDELLRIVLYVFVPYTVLSPFLGVAIDRWDRRRLLVVANGARAALVAAVALAGTGRVGDLPLFLAFLLTLALTRLVLATKAAALPVALGGDDELVEANAVSQFGGALFQLGGAGAAFVASAAVDAEPIVLVGGAVYLAGALAAAALRRAGEARPRSSFAAEVRRVATNILAGVSEVARRPQAGAAISTYFWLRALWSFAIVGIGFVARALVDDDDLALLALTGGAGALGAALGFTSAQRLHRRARSAAHLVLSASLGAGMAVAVLGALGSKGATAALAFSLGLGFFLAKISLDTMVQQALGDGFRGRAFSLYDIAYNLAWVLAAGVMKLAWSEGAEGGLIAGSGVVFLVGLGLLAVWYQQARLLALPAGVTGPRAR